MNTISNAETFFFISAVGFVVLWLLLAVLIFYFIKATKTFARIMENIEEDIDSMGDTTKEMLKDVRDSMIFNFIFKKKKRNKN
jgi:large-conductance mechanosensitive channel